MDVVAAITELSRETLPQKAEERRQQLAAYLNTLVLHDFEKLIQLLYRVDVAEKKLKAVLQQHPTQDAGLLIADLLINRQREKAVTRQQFRFPSESSDEERW